MKKSIISGGFVVIVLLYHSGLIFPSQQRTRMVQNGIGSVLLNLVDKRQQVSCIFKFCCSKVLFSCVHISCSHYPDVRARQGLWIAFWAKLPVLQLAVRSNSRAPAFFALWQTDKVLGSRDQMNDPMHLKLTHTFICDRPAVVCSFPCQMLARSRQGFTVTQTSTCHE